jgi:hypothetical protein
MWTACLSGYRVLCRDLLLNDRAVFDAGTATGAQVLPNITGSFSDLDLEIPGSACYRLKIRIGNQLDVHVPADLDQFG